MDKTIEFLMKIIDDKEDVFVVWVLSFLTTFYFFTSWVTIAAFVTMLIYQSVRKISDEAFAAGMFIWFLAAVLVVVVITQEYPKNEISRTTTALEDIRFVPGFKMIVNYNKPDKIQIVELTEKNWYKFQATGCEIVQHNIHSWYWVEHALDDTIVIDCK